MKLVKQKVIKIFSNGSFIFDYDITLKSEKFKFYEKDHKNFYFNQKIKIQNQIILENFSNYKITT